MEKGGGPSCRQQAGLDCQSPGNLRRGPSWCGGQQQWSVQGIGEEAFRIGEGMVPAMRKYLLPGDCDCIKKDWSDK